MQTQWTVQASFVLAMVPPELAEEGTELEMDVLGTLHEVTVVPESPFDPENERLRT
jgi:dimethylglycine dehydrogenase